MGPWAKGMSGNPTGRKPIEYDADLVERVRSLYNGGLTQAEVAEAVGITQKVVWRLMSRHGIERRRQVKRDQRGASNASWKGDAAGYQALHVRVEAERGRPSRCDRCGTTTANRYEWANLTGRYEDTGDYERMCIPCHRAFDAARREATGGRTSPRRGVRPNV